jgi:hypothetical protein
MTTQSIQTLLGLRPSNGVAENKVILGYDTVSLRQWFPAF